MSQASEIIVTAIGNMLTDVRIVGAAMLLLSVAVLGPRLMRRAIEREQITTEVEEIDRRVAWYGLDAGESEQEVEAQVREMDFGQQAAWLRAAGWEDVRGDEIVVENDLLGSLVVIDAGAERLEVEMPEIEERRVLEREVDAEEARYRAYVA